MGSFRISEGNITGRTKKKKKKTYRSREIPQMLTSASSERGLNREVWAACLG